MSNSTTYLLTVAIALLMTSGQVFAAPSACSSSYGSIAYSESLRKPFLGCGNSSLDAEANAWNSCDAEAHDCNSAVWVQNGYISIAVDQQKGSWGTGWGPTQSAAEHWASDVCESNGGTNCTPPTNTTTWSANPQQSAMGGRGFASVLSLELNLTTDPVKSPSAQLREVAQLNPVVGEIVNAAQCAIDFLPVAGKVLKLGKRTVKVIKRVETVDKVGGVATLVIVILQDVQTGEVIVRVLRIVGDVLNFVIPGADCVPILEGIFFAPPPLSTVKAPITPIPVPTPIPPS